MMQDYLRVKEEHKDCILMCRVGDFFEMFFDDALTASKELELTLTGKDCGLPERAPMCGVPYHAVDNYITRLVKMGHKVALYDQVEDPRFAKGLVKRDITRIVTPGTNFDYSLGEEGRNHYLVSVMATDDRFGLAACDASTGEFLMTETDRKDRLFDELMKLAPAEMICNEAAFVLLPDLEDLRAHLSCLIEPMDDRIFGDESAVRAVLDHFHASSPEGLGIDTYPCGTCAAGALLTYLFDTQKTDLSHITKISTYRTENYMVLGNATVRNLELVETLREKEKKGSLLHVLDRTRTAMGARMLRMWIEQPLIVRSMIEERADAVEALTGNEISLSELREYMNPVYDLERLAGRVSFRTANPRDLTALRQSLGMLPHIRQLLGDFPCGLFQRYREEMDTLPDLFDLLTASIPDDPPVAMREGGIIRDGYSGEVDELRRAKTDGKRWLAELEAREKEKTGIHNLKVKFNRVFGYCIEVSNSMKDKVPDNYIRKQTLVSGERFTTPELKELEDKILGAQDRLYSLEYELYSEIRSRIGDNIVRIQNTAKMIAEIDALASLAYVALRNRYIRPKITDGGEIRIKGGRHPVVEKMMHSGSFVPNDTSLDTKKHRIAVITGPNMAGKSTYMRQTALIVLMAQIGSFVPADEAEIGVVDRIFTRVGASDDLASGQSTFMVEMTEVASILRGATSRSLLILDEIGRGTSTFDGLALAWAIIEYIADKKLIGAKTLFATHYHELTELEGKIDGVNNYCIAVREKGDSIVFLRKIVKGGADKSYGIQVARLAGVPEAVLVRADHLVRELMKADITETIETIAGSKRKRKNLSQHYDDVDLQQMSFFDTVSDTDIIEDLKKIEIETLTPIDALNELYRLQNKLKNRWKNT